MISLQHMDMQPLKEVTKNLILTNNNLNIDVLKHSNPL